MVFRDQRLVCQECGKSYFFTVTEQRRQAEQVGEENIEAPQLCPSCRRKELPLSPAAPEPVAQAEYEDRTERVEQVEYAEHPQQAERPRRERRAGRRERAERREYSQETRPGESQAQDVEVDDFPLEEAGIELKLIGEVKWFNRRKGYGFVTMAGGEEVFFHRSDVSGGQLSQIKDGIQVEFQVRRTDKGMEAFNVSILPSS
jgi:CspA family cold shock protein